MKKIHYTKGSKAKGASGLEYGVIVGLVSIVAILSVRGVGDNVVKAFDNAAQTLSGFEVASAPKDVLSDTVEVVPPVVPNIAPQISIRTDRTGLRVVNQDGVLQEETFATYEVSDEDGDTLSVSLSNGSDFFNFEEQGSEVVISPKADLSVGEYSYTLVVEDGEDQASESGSVQVVAFEGLSNGDFDSTENTQTRDYGRSTTDPVGWSLTSGAVFEMVDTASSPENNLVYPPALSGSYSFDTIASVADPVSIEQEILIDPYSEYTFKGYFARAKTAEPGVVAVVYWNDAEIARVSVDQVMTWQEERFVLPATGSTSGVLRIEGQGSDRANGVLVDSVSVTPGDVSFDQSSPERTKVGLVNGSFESGAGGEGWSVRNSYISYSNAETESPGVFAKTVDGDYYFDGIGAAGNPLSNYQDVVVRPGHMYRITYWWGARHVNNPNRTMDVVWNGNVVDTVTTGPEKGFERKILTVTADSGDASGRLSFDHRPYSGTSAHVGLHLDNISVVDLGRP